MVEYCLLDAGASVVGFAASIGEAEEMLLSLRPDGVLLDLDLDGVSALPLAARLHGLQVPFVVTTGYDPEAVPAGLAAEVLMKPYDLAKLVNAVERMCAGRLGQPVQAGAAQAGAVQAGATAAAGLALQRPG